MCNTLDHSITYRSIQKMKYMPSAMYLYIEGWFECVYRVSYHSSYAINSHMA